MTSSINWALVAAAVAFLAVLAASREVRRVAVTGWVGLRYLAKGVRRRLRGERHVAPELVRRAFEELGPTYIKLGQIVASSVGLFPRRYATEFQKCLDRVRPFPYEEVVAIVEKELGAPISELFASFDREPLASASIAQVHAARLLDGEDVVVKIQRPKIGERVDADVGILHAGAELLAILPQGELANPVAIVEDFDATIHEELDFLREAENMDEFNRIMVELGHRDIAAPRVISRLTTERVLTMERFYGVRVDDVAGVRAFATDGEERLVHGVRAWFQCMILYGFFHGDVHAGNLMVLSDGRLGFLDFGIIGRFDDRQRWMVTDYILAFSTGDYRRLGDVMLAMNSVSQKVNLDELAADLQVAFSPIITRTLGQLNYGEILPAIMKVAFKHRMRLPNEFVLVTKQMLFFDRYAKLLAPNLNIFSDPRLIAALAGDVVRARTSPSPPQPPRRRRRA